MKQCLMNFYSGSGDRPAATTMAYVRLLSKLLRDKDIGDLIVPIIPDEARSFGMEALFRQAGIYSHPGQVYEPVDSDTFLFYKEATDGQILEEGITEAGAYSSFIAAGTAYATHGVNTIPFFYFLFHVWVPEGRRPYLGWVRHEVQGLLYWMYFRKKFFRRRRTAAPGRQQPPLRFSISNSCLL